MTDLNKIEPFYPVWCRAPNKLVRYEERRFVCGTYHGTKRIAIFTDKSGTLREETAQVIWDDL